VTGSTTADSRRKSMQGAPAPGPQGNRPEDNKESPEYKKKAALLTGPILSMDYGNAKSYGMSESIFTALKDIFESVMAHPSRTGVVSPQRFVETLKRENELFRSQMHQDAHEFLNYLLNQVVEKTEEYEKGGSAGSNTPVLTSATASTDASGSGGTTNWVHDIFEGTLTSETKCLTCENVSQRDETFLDLSIDLEKHSSVTSCLRNFSQSEMLCERNKFHCDKCGGLQEAEKRMKIKHAPRILALHLKRFKYTEDLARLTKLFHRVVYPYHLRLFNTTDDAEDPDRLYELYAVVVHIGGGPYHGHYVSIIKTEDRGWLLFDDEMVEPVDKSYVRNFFGDKPGLACAYVLFYQETTLETVRAEQAAEELAAIKSANPEAAKVGLYAHGKANGHLSNGHTSHLVHTGAIDEVDSSSSLNHSVSDPLMTSQNSPPHPEKTPMFTSIPKMEIRSKKAKAKEREAKQAEKEREKAEKQRIKDVEARKKEIERKHKEDEKAAIAASRLSKAEEDQRRAKEAEKHKENGALGGGGLSRFRHGSKSMSGRNKFWGKDKPKDMKDLSRDSLGLDSGGDEGSTTTLAQHPAPEIKGGEKKTHRFSGLKKKASILH
jgi:ubiquitin carboxyl-terminal hydrolase 9/13